ncbi:MAG: signal peptidase I [Myxococcota bacterium]|jgi:signal peptidase I|nr:signal peptidase I [Myxococcota bacterium]
MGAKVKRISAQEVKQLRKESREMVREALKLNRRGRGKVARKIRNEVADQIERLKKLQKSNDYLAIGRASEELQKIIEKHFAPFRKAAWRESLESIIVAVLVALFLRSFVVEAFKIPSGSMIPALAIGDQIFVNKFLYGLRIPFTSIRLVEFDKPKRGEVIVFICPLEPHEDYIKRVVGLPGDEIAVREGQILINEKPIKRKYKGKLTHWDRDQRSGKWYPFKAFAYREVLGRNSMTALYDVNMNKKLPDFGPVKVPKGHVFVMGDNRDHSFDSRSWGHVPMENILGRSMFVWWSWGKDGLAFDRLGESVD